VTGTSQRRGLVQAFGAFFLWGLFPIYWKQLAAVPALEVVAHRTVWGFACLAAWVTLRRRWAEVRSVAGAPRTIAVLTGGAALIGFNWLLYIWAVTHGHVVDASLGYYLNPLVNVLLGIVLLRERLSRRQALAVALAACGVGVLTIRYGGLPWISLALAGSFGLYGLVRKTVAADALVGLLWETALLTPFAALFLAVAAAHGTGAFGHGPAHDSLLLALAGAVTVVPLMLFALGARALPLSTLGFVQYVSPSLQFLLGVFLYHEPFGVAQAVAFAFIWAALVLLTLEMRRRFGRRLAGPAGVDRRPPGA
jgi:chloramphenicol-sensitive protein RarD